MYVLFDIEYWLLCMCILVTLVYRVQNCRWHILFFMYNVVLYSSIFIRIRGIQVFQYQHCWSTVVSSRLQRQLISRLSFHPVFTYRWQCDHCFWLKQSNFNASIFVSDSRKLCHYPSITFCYLFIGCMLLVVIVLLRVIELCVVLQFSRVYFSSIDEN